MSTTPGSQQRPTRDPQTPHPFPSSSARKRQRGSLSSHHPRPGVRKSLKFGADESATKKSSEENVGNATTQSASAASGSLIHIHIQPVSHLSIISEESTTNPPVPNFWNNPPPPPSSPPNEGDTTTVHRRSMRLRTKAQFPIAQITDSSPSIRTEPTSDLLLRCKAQAAVFDRTTSDYGTSSENSLYFRPSAGSAFSFASAASSHRQELLPRCQKESKNSHPDSLPSSQSVGYVSDLEAELDDCLSNLSIEDVKSNNNNKLAETKSWDSDDANENSEWDDITEEVGNHLSLNDLHFEDIHAVHKSVEGINVLMPLDALMRHSKRVAGHPVHLKNRYFLRNRHSSKFEEIIDIQTFRNTNLGGCFLPEGLRVFQISPIISIKPYEVEFITLLPAIIQIPLMMEPLPGDEVHCLYCKSPGQGPVDFAKIPWKSVEAGKFSINNGSVYFEAFHFGLFVLIIRPKSPISSRVKEIRTRVGGKLTVSEFPSVEIIFPKEATNDVIIPAQARVFLDTEESVSEFLVKRAARIQIASSMEIDNIADQDQSTNCLATPILQLEPHGIHFPINRPVTVTLPVPDYDKIMKISNGTAKLNIWQSNTQVHETARWERLDVQYEVSKLKLNGELITVVTFPVYHFSFFKGVWECISSCMFEAKIGMLYYFVSFAMKCQANMEEYGDIDTPANAPSTANEDGNEQQKQICGGSRFGLEVSMFDADKPWPQNSTYKYKVGHSNVKLVKPGRLCIRLKSHYFVPDVQAGEEEDMMKEETDFRGREFEKQFILKFKPDVKIDRGPFGKVLITRHISQRQTAQPIFEFNIQKHGNEADVTPIDYQSEQWSIVALRELANNLFVTDGDNWKQFAQDAGMTKQEIRDANLKHDSDAFQKIVNHYRQRGGTPQELVDVMYRCHRTIKIRGNFSPQSSNQTKSSNGSSGRGSLSSNNGNFNRFGSHDSDTSGKTSGTRTSQDSGLPPGRKRSHQLSVRGSGGGSLTSSKAKRKRFAESLPGPSHNQLYGDSQSDADADEEASDSDLDRVPATPSSTNTRSVISTEEHSKNKNDKSVLNTQYLWAISESINKTSWRALGRTLGLEEAILVEVDHGYSKTSFRECSYQMLLEWKQRFPKRCTFGTLYTALNKEGMAAAGKQMIEIDPTSSAD